MNETGGETLPRIIVAVSNFSEIKNEKNELYIMSLAQKARAAGIHLLVSDSENSKYLPGTVKANIPSRLCFKVSCAIESRKILDMNGAEHLTALNDGLYLGIGYNTPVRLTTVSISEDELADRTPLLNGDPEDKTRLELSPSLQKKDGQDDDGEDSIFSDDRFKKAVELALSSGTISTSLLQRKLGIGYGLSAKLIDYMESFGLISEPNGQFPRKLLMSREEWENFIKDKVN
jgi:S-DNA-T family DNA segregation ATPase FtsK/SpoIIIE